MKGPCPKGKILEFPHGWLVMKFITECGTNFKSRLLFDVTGNKVCNCIFTHGN